MPRAAVAVRWTVRLLLVLLLLAALAAGIAWRAVAASRPVLDGREPLAGLSAPATVSRDAIGTAVVKAANARDAARALGFVHAQERFFEMDLTRRSAAGELSALFGPRAVERDEGRRLHRLRARLTARLAQLPAEDRALLQAYADGVNAGLARPGTRPWQYLLLRAKPQPWQPVDSLLVVAEMFWTLQETSVRAGFERALLRERTGDALFAFLEPRGGRWDAALDGSTTPPVPIPGPDVIDLRNAPAPRAMAAARPAPVPAEAARATDAPHRLASLDDRVARALAPGVFRAPVTAPGEEAPVLGSNDWAVSGARSTHGGAIVADDMHLGLSTPGLWFRAQLEIGQGPEALRAEGVTLPGVPAIVVGSNGHVAWGFTNAYGQWFDWLRIPDGVADDRVRRVVETIEVKGAAPVAYVVTEFDGWPVQRREDGHAYALRWIGDQGDAYDLHLAALMQARDVASALRIAQASGLPHQNIVVADDAGHIGWTVAGHLWDQHDALDRVGRFQPVDRPVPGWLPPAAYPVIVDPPAGQLWTANARQLGGPGGAVIGDGGFDLGARAQQIRDRLAERPRHDEASLSALQLDDDARFMRSWAARLQAVVKEGAPGAGPQDADVRRVLAAWDGRADADQAGYLLVRRVRQQVLDALWVAWTTPALGDRQADPARQLPWHRMFEYAAESALDQRPPHLLPRPWTSWDAFLRGQVDQAAKALTEEGRRPLSRATWGEANASHIQHVLARAVPALSKWLDPASRPQSGDANLPHVAGPAFGQSERMVVSPGREAQGTLVVAGGQSGHPLSPYYLAGHDTWAAGRTSPLLAGPPQHVLALLP